jgi:hypothetical protein
VKRYGSAESSTSAEATPTSSETKTGTMPSLVGLTLSQAMRKMTTNMRIASDEAKDDPPTPEKAFTIFDQSPLAETRINLDQELVVKVKRYGPVKATVEQPKEVAAQSNEESGAQAPASATPRRIWFPRQKYIGEDRWIEGHWITLPPVEESSRKDRPKP